MAIAKSAHSPEERLLKLLRADSGSKQNQRHPFNKREVKPGLAQFGSANIIKKTNLFLLFLFVVCLIRLLFKFFAPSVYKIRMEEIKLYESDISASSNADITRPEPVTFDGLSRNDLFLPAYSAAQNAPPVQTGYDALSGLTLMGIISGENPQAIIEDRKDGKAHFLFKGERVRDFRIKDILDGKIIIISGTQEEFELKL